MTSEFDAKALITRIDPKSSIIVHSKLTEHNKPVLFSKEALLYTQAYVGSCEEEIGWLGTVEDCEDHYLIDKIYLFDQEVTGSTTELEAESIEKLILKISEDDGPDAAADFNNRLRFWGHSHVKMDVLPSGTDDSTMTEQFGNGNVPFAVRAIANKLGQMKVDVYRYDIGLEFHDVAWWQEGEDFSEIIKAAEEEIKEKVLEKKYVAPTSLGGWKNGKQVMGLTDIEKEDLGSAHPWWKKGQTAKIQFFDDFFALEEEFPL